MITSDQQTNAADGAPIRPSRVWYWVAGSLLAGAAICIGLGATGPSSPHQQATSLEQLIGSFDQQINSLQRVPAPGKGQVAFIQPGGYILYIEGPGDSYGAGGMPSYSHWSMNAGLRPAAGGPPVPMSTRSDSTYSYNGTEHQGQSAMYFTISHPGQYVLTITNVTPKSITDVAVGRGVQAPGIPAGPPGTPLGTLLILVGAFGLTPAGAVIAWITAVRRHRARSRMQRATAMTSAAGAAGETPADATTPEPTNDPRV